MARATNTCVVLETVVERDLMDDSPTAARRASDGEAALRVQTWPAGLIVLASAAYATRSIVKGLEAARGLIGDFEAAHGELQIDNGHWAHTGAPEGAARLLCDQVDEAAGWLYPFGALVWTPVFVLVLAGSLLTFRSARSPIPASLISVLLLAALVAVALSFSPVYAEVNAILE